MGGWTGQVLRVNLSTRRWQVEALRWDWARQFVGGLGLGTRYFVAEVDPRVDPFASENKLIFATGLLTGTKASCAACYMVVTKGALNGTLTTSNSGGHWGPELKFAGYDLLILEGRSERPVYLFVNDQHVEFREAGHLWGQSVWETEDRIRQELGLPDVRIASIGPAGERLVRFAAILNDRHRAAGRNGVGAVMGAKGLKAIAVRGTGAVRVARPTQWMQAQGHLRWRLRSSPVTAEGLPEFGTAVLLHVINDSGALPTKNWQQAVMRSEVTGSDAEKISGERLKERHTLRNKACFACTIACGRVTRVSEAGLTRHWVTTSPHNWRIAGEGPEYENLWALGANTNVDDLDAVLKASFLCNKYGMDPISFGATLATAMEMYERGILTEEMDYTLEDLCKAGERIFNLERLWLLRAGFTGADDTLPKRLLEEPISAGPAQGQVCRLTEMLPEYYRLQGWSADGQPTPEKLAELELIDLV